MIHYQKAIQYETSATHYNNRGLANYHIDNLMQAEMDYNDALKINPHDATIYFNRGNVYLNQGLFEKAHDDYQTAIDKEPNNPKFYHSKGLTYEAEGTLDEERQDNKLLEAAIHMYTAALKLQENFISSRFHLGMMYHRTNQFTYALRCFS